MKRFILAIICPLLVLLSKAQTLDYIQPQEVVVIPSDYTKICGRYYYDSSEDPSEYSTKFNIFTRDYSQSVWGDDLFGDDNYYWDEYKSNSTVKEIRFMPNSRVTEIGSYSFCCCFALESIDLPNSLTAIGGQAFFYCNKLNTISIPSGVTQIHYEAFRGCSGLTSVTIPGSVTSIGSWAFTGCTGTLTVNCDIPSNYNNDWSPFYESSFSNVIIGNGVTSIGNYAFPYCRSLTSVTIPNSVTSIGLCAFWGCSGLTSVTIPNSVTSIGSSAFEYCSGLTSVKVEWDTPVTISSSRTFSNSANATLYVPRGSKAAYEKANYWKEFKQIVEYDIPVNISFADASVKAICVQNWDTDGDGELNEAEATAVTDLGTVFKGKAISSFDEMRYFTGLTSIGRDAFYGCTGLTSVTIPNSVTSIGEYAFRTCSGLTSVTIPGSVTSIGNNAFWGCFGLTKVNIEDISAWCNISFASYDSNPLSYAHHLYLNGEEIKNLVIPDGVTSIGNDAFRDCSGLTSVTIPNSVTNIESLAFVGCSGLTSVHISDLEAWCNIQFTNAFSSPLFYAHHLYLNGEEVNDLVIPNSVMSIGNSAFDGCSGLTSVAIPNSVTSIGNYAFERCSGLTSVTIPNSVTSIGNGAFSECSGLTSVTIPNSVTSIGNSAFEYCSGLTSVKVETDTPVTISSSNTFSNSANATLYVPKGSKAAYEKANYWKEFKQIVEFPDADVNQDGEIDVVDVVDIARFVVGTPGDSFVEFLADLNSDDNVNVADAVVLVNEIAGEQNFAKAFGAQREMGDDRLTLTENADHSLAFAMESQRDYTAFQFDLYTNSEDDVMGLRLNNARKHGHQLIYNKVDEGHYCVVALSVANNTFNGSNGELLNIQLDGFNSADMTISNIHFITTDGTDYRFDDLSLSNATGIEGLTSNPSTKDDGNVYDLSGRKVSVSSANDESTVLPKGIYIKNGRKVVVK